jgi:3-oxoacyl-[acyl-carrier-protein] synthase II
MGEFGAALTVERSVIAKARGAKVLARLTGWATRQDPIDLSVSKDGGALVRAIGAALTQAGRVAGDVEKLVVLDRGLAPTFTATRHAFAHVFGAETPPITRPADVCGYAPSSGAMMTVLAAMQLPKGVTLATGYDVIGEAFAFVIEGADQ